MQRVIDQDEGLEGEWKKMMDKDVAGAFTYTAARRALPSGTSEYRTVTVYPDTSPMELMEFLLDDDARRGWEAFLINARTLEQGYWPSREDVVRWVRRFPFNFLSDREYVIARKAWAVQGPASSVQQRAPLLAPLNGAQPGATLYAVTQGMDAHPAAPLSSSLVRTTAFLSRWRCRAVPDPWGGPHPAAEVVLLHTEDIKIPEYLARTAIGLGMKQFIKDLADGLARFKYARRARGIEPHKPDPLAYGHDWAKQQQADAGLLLDGGAAGRDASLSPWLNAASPAPVGRQSSNVHQLLKQEEADAEHAAISGMPPRKQGRARNVLRVLFPAVGKKKGEVQQAGAAGAQRTASLTAADLKSLRAAGGKAPDMDIMSARDAQGKDPRGSMQGTSTTYTSSAQSPMGSSAQGTPGYWASSSPTGSKPAAATSNPAAAAASYYQQQKAAGRAGARWQSVSDSGSGDVGAPTMKLQGLLVRAAIAGAVLLVGRRVMSGSSHRKSASRNKRAAAVPLSSSQSGAQQVVVVRSHHVDDDDDMSDDE